MLDQPRELEVIEVAGIVTFLLVEHLFDFFFRESLAHGLEETLKFFAGNDFGAFGVEAFEGVLDDIFGIGSVQLLTEEREEAGEVDVSGSFLDHVFQVRCWGIFAHGRERASEIFRADETVTILVDHVEGFLELLNLRLTEQSEDIGGGLLGLLLSGSLLFAHPDSLL